MDWASLAGSAIDKGQTAASFGKGLATGVKDGVVSLAEGLWSLGKGAVTTSYRAATDPAYREAVFQQAKSLANSAADYGGRLMDDPATRKEAYERVQDLVG